MAYFSERQQQQPAPPVSYPQPPRQSQSGPFVAAPPPVGYPTRDGPGNSEMNLAQETSTRGGGFLKGCCAALCCCWILDVCFCC